MHKENDGGAPADRAGAWGAGNLHRAVGGWPSGGALATIGQGSGLCTPAEVGQIIEHAGSFICLLRGHIQKEDHILYPMAQQAIPPAAFDQLDAACADFERQVIGVEKIRQLQDLARELVAAYPPDPEKMAAATACAGCYGH